MSILYEKISQLCEQRGITRYKMCKEIGIQPSIVTDLKSGRKKGYPLMLRKKLQTILMSRLRIFWGSKPSKKKSLPKPAGLLLRE